jgi:hypothetical protein
LEKTKFKKRGTVAGANMAEVEMWRPAKPDEPDGPDGPEELGCIQSQGQGPTGPTISRVTALQLAEADVSEGVVVHGKARPLVVVIGTVETVEPGADRVVYTVDDGSGTVSAAYDLDDQEAVDAAALVQTGRLVRIVAKPRPGPDGVRLSILSVRPVDDTDEVEYHRLTCQLAELRYGAGLL